MPLAVPSLDTRTFDDLIAQAKQLIPRYLPEWTDLNESDPGIVLVELFSWMTEATLYELNQAPAVLQLKLLQLLGFTALPPQPAATQLTFTLGSGVEWVDIPPKTRVAASGATNPDGSPVIFETDASVIAIAATLQGVAGYDDDAIVPFFSDPTTPPALPFTPFPATIAVGDQPALYLCFTTPSGVSFPSVIVDLAIFLNDAPGDNAPPPQYTCTLGGAPPVPPATWRWEYVANVTTSTDASGNTVSTPVWKPVKLFSDGTAALYRSGHVQFQLPVTPAATFAAFATITDPTVADYAKLTGWWVRATLTSASYEQPPSIAAIATNTAPATQAQTVTGEVVGASSGLANQTFTLANTPVLPATLVLTIDEGTGSVETWTRVDDLYGTTGNDQVYTLDPGSGTIAFGDGTFGAIPLANPTTPQNIVAQTYRYGGGSAGNVAANAITDVQSYVAYVSSVTNPIPAQGGSDAEAPDVTALRAAHDIRSTNRAVTAEDFSALALETPGALVARAEALPLRHPDYGTLDIPGCVTVIVVPQREVDEDPATQPTGTPPPTPNQTTLEAVCAWLDQHRLVTTELHVVGPTYHTLTFAMTAYCATSADLGAVQTGIENALRALYAPVGPNGGWPWGATAYAAVAFATAMNVAGVTRIDSDFTMTLDGTPVPALGDATIGPTDLLWVPVGGVTVTATYDTSS